MKQNITKYGLKAKRKRTSSKRKINTLNAQTQEKDCVDGWGCLGKEQEDAILREFDLNYKFGPCVGIGRLARWKRAQSLGLEPPRVVLEILEKRGLETEENLFEKYKSLI